MVVGKLVNSVRGGLQDAELSWDELQAVEKRRRSILKRQGNFSFFRIVFFWDGTLLKMLSSEPLLWLTIIIYAFIRIFAHLDALPEVLNDIAGADIGVIGVFLSFFLVLFVNDANSTVEKIYGISMQCKARVLDVAALAKTTLPRKYALRLVRYMNAVHIAGYVGLSRVYTYSNFFVPINNLNRLLTPEEIERIESIDMNDDEAAYREIITWCLDEVATAADEELISGFVASKFRELILKEQDSFGELFDDEDQSISFAYYHFICFLSAVYLPLFGMSAGLVAGIGEAAYWLTDIVAGLIVVLQAIFVVGLRVLAENMSDPFGDDVDNLSVLHYINFTWKTSMQMMLAKKPRPIDQDTEERLCEGRPPLEEPWDADEKNARVDVSSSAFGAGGSLSTSPSNFSGAAPLWSTDEVAAIEMKWDKEDTKSKQKSKSKSRHSSSDRGSPLVTHSSVPSDAYE